MNAHRFWIAGLVVGAMLGAGPADAATLITRWEGLPPEQDTIQLAEGELAHVEVWVQLDSETLCSLFYRNQLKAQVMHVDSAAVMPGWIDDSIPGVLGGGSQQVWFSAPDPADGAQGPGEFLIGIQIIQLSVGALGEYIKVAPDEGTVELLDCLGAPLTVPTPNDLWIEVVGPPGACCDWSTLTCQNDVREPDCQGTYDEWFLETPCSALDPPCGPTPLGTAFSYQGQLKNAGQPVEGQVDFIFKLYATDQALGVPIADPLVFDGQPGNFSPIDVENGLFTVILDFGEDVFTGDARWLQIAVRIYHDPDDAESYETLDPLQRLTPAPHALYAKKAPWDGLSGMPPGFADGSDDDALGSMSCMDGQVLKWLLDAWTCADDDIGVADYWSLTGPTTNFLGTTDNVALELRVNNERALRIEPTTHTPNLIGGYFTNQVTAGVTGATISGGGGNEVTDDQGTVGGGDANLAGDGEGSTSNAAYATVAGGLYNRATAYRATVGGGGGPSAAEGNVAAGSGSTVAGGTSNRANVDWSSIGGGLTNTVTDKFSTIGGGACNVAGNELDPIDDAEYATVAGGYYNEASAANATIAGGASNNVYDYMGTVGGGGYNEAGTFYGGDEFDALHATVAGGYYNEAGAAYATVAGGSKNEALAAYATVAGGGPSDPGLPDTTNNRVTDNYGTIGGGGGNLAGNNADPMDDAAYATVSGGQDNEASNDFATVGGGIENVALGYAAAIGGGRENTADGAHPAIGGGLDNDTAGDRPTIAGGEGNDVTDSYGTVGGGYYNQAGNNADPGGTTTRRPEPTASPPGSEPKPRIKGTLPGQTPVRSIFLCPRPTR